jgi:putative transposase
MPIKAVIIPMIPGRYYHVYNRGNNKERLFFGVDDYKVFLNKYFHYLGPVADTYAYCLLPNHFHFLIRIRENQGEFGLNTSNQLRKLLISYARRININRKRYGCLLTRNYRRVEIDSDQYLRNMILYIHFNPVKHGIESNFVIYPYSTFKEFFTDRSSPIKKEEVIDWFDGYGEFFNLHRVIDKDDLIKNMIKDD